MDLQTVLKNAKFATSKDLSRTPLCGVYFDLKGDYYNIVATDGHLLYCYALSVDDVRHGFLLMGLLDLMPEESFIFYQDEKTRQKAGVKIFDTDEVYPKYQNVIPSEGIRVSQATFYVAFDPERHFHVKKILKSHGEKTPSLGIRYVTTRLGAGYTELTNIYERSLVLLMPLRMED